MASEARFVFIERNGVKFQLLFFSDGRVCVSVNNTVSSRYERWIRPHWYARPPWMWFMSTEDMIERACRKILKKYVLIPHKNYTEVAEHFAIEQG